MNAKTRFAQMDDEDLCYMWNQYGAPLAAAHYRGFARRALLAEMRRRGLSVQKHSTYIGKRPKGYGPLGTAYAWGWGVKMPIPRSGLPVFAVQL